MKNRKIRSWKVHNTEKHPFYVYNKGFVKAEKLRAGDILVSLNGEKVILEKVQHEILENPVKVYNFEVEDYHTYFVGTERILVHNACGGIASADVGGIEGGTNTVNPNALKYNGDGTWTSNSGLIYGQGSKEGNRVLHVLEHTKPNPNKPVHTVFNVDKSNVIGLVDEAWNSRGVGNLASNGYVTYNIDMGKTIGTNGETFMRIVTNGYTNKLISAYPIP